MNDIHKLAIAVIRDAVDFNIDAEQTAAFKEMLPLYEAAPTMLTVLKYTESWIKKHGLGTALLINGQYGENPILTAIRDVTKMAERKE